MTSDPWRTVALVARTPGLLILRDALLNTPDIELMTVITHADLPRAEGGGNRPDLSVFERICRTATVPFHALDGKQSRDIGPCLPDGSLDLLVSLSWRNLIRAETLSRFTRTLNIHRGAPPRYAGAKPVENAVAAGEPRVAITAHEMIEEIDAGRTIADAWHDISPKPSGMTAAQYAEIIKTDLEPLYAPLTITAIGRLRQEAEADAAPGA